MILNSKKTKFASKSKCKYIYGINKYILLCMYYNCNCWFFDFLNQKSRGVYCVVSISIHLFTLICFSFPNPNCIFDDSVVDSISMCMFKNVLCLFCFVCLWQCEWKRCLVVERFPNKSYCYKLTKSTFNYKDLPRQSLGSKANFTFKTTTSWKWLT